MADRVYPSARPTATNGTATTNSFPATKAQLYGASHPAYRLTPQRKRSRRGCCCVACLWVTLIIFILLLLAAVAGAILYVIYLPHRPTFAVSGFKVSSLNLTSTSHLTTNINMNITTKNPNKMVIFIYNPVTITVTTDDKNEILIGSGLLPSFVHGTKNTTLLKAAITSSSNQQLDDRSASQLKTDLKSKNGLALKIELETRVKVRMDELKSPKVGIRVTCDGIKVTAPSGKTATSASVSNAKCKVDLRIKIWKWTF